MGGCTNCKAKSGCDDRKGSMLAEVDHVLAHLYPSRTWGESDEREYADPPTPEELAALADDLASELNAATFVRPGDDSEPCDYLYVLCMGRAPCAVQVRDEGVPVPTEWHGVPRLDELYLRIVISHRARIAAVQQVAIAVTADGAGGFVVREAPRAGVYDAPLLPRMQKLVAIVPAYDLLHVDFGEIAHPPDGFHAGGWPDLYGAPAPAIANYLFYPQPTTMVATAHLG